MPIGYQRVNCHIIFDVKMEDSRHKGGLVTGVHVTEPPYNITYANSSVNGESHDCFDIGCLELLAIEGSLNSEFLHHGACHREDIESPGP